MKDHFDDIEVLPPKKVWRKRNLLHTIPPPSVRNSKKENGEINNSCESKIRFDKWIMPTQPEGYLKCPRYDFL